MKVATAWLKELINLNTSIEGLVKILPLKTISTKEVTDQFIELDMKGYNRADLLSMRGVALEVAAITDSRVTFEETDPANYFWIDKSLPKLEVKIEDENLTPVYCLVKIDNLKVTESSKEWQEKIADSGMRPVNNIADVTNLVMLEYGQPLHAFDADAVKDQQIIVRLAKQGEKLETLDSKTRELSSKDLVIADIEKALGLAGVMGGKDSEVTNTTTSILLEAAIFDPGTLRKTANNHKLISEASKRFYHGLTKKRLLQALNAAINYYRELGGEVTALTLTEDLEDQAKKIPLSLTRVNSLIGVELSADQVEDYLSKLNCHLEKTENREGEHAWVVTPAYYRADLEIEEDLIEEVARMYGYEMIKPQKLSENIPEKIDQSLFELIAKVKNSLVDLGLTEVQTYSFYSTKVLNTLEFQNHLKLLVKVANPISSETEYMRLNVWPNLLEVISKNQDYKDVAIFEVGKTFTPQENDRPKESYVLSIALTNQTDNPLAELNSIAKKLFEEFNIEISPLDKTQPPVIDLFHPNRFLKVIYKEKQIGGLSQVHPQLEDKFGVEKRVAILEINLENILDSNS